tara:strand:- start:4 stop:999 length:996 start_codon:yes stop_codon:yes gene_type:complete
LIDIRKLLKKGSDFLGCQFPIIGGAMTWVSEKNLVSAISNAGGLGVIACGAMEPSLLENEIISTQKLTKNPIGVNLILMHPKIEKLIEICIENKIQFIVFAGGIPKKKYINQFKAKRIKTIAFASTLFIANRLKNFGIDALIIEGSEAGGHIGPVSTNVLAQEILPFISEIPIFVAGGIGRGESFLNYLRQGAAGCQIGTRFVCASESVAHDNFKNIFIKSESRSAQVSIQLDDRLPVIPVRAIKNKASVLFLEKQKEVLKNLEQGNVSLKEAQLTIEKFWSGSLKKAVIDGDIENGSLMAGQSVSMVKKIQPVKEIIEEIIQQASHEYNE